MLDTASKNGRLSSIAGLPSESLRETWFSQAKTFEVLEHGIFKKSQPERHTRVLNSTSIFSYILTFILTCLSLYWHEFECKNDKVHAIQKVLGACCVMSEKYVPFSSFLQRCNATVRTQAQPPLCLSHSEMAHLCMTTEMQN